MPCKVNFFTRIAIAEYLMPNNELRAHNFKPSVGKIPSDDLTTLYAGIASLQSDLQQTKRALQQMSLGLAASEDSQPALVFVF
jgi:hypothetical protein